MDAKAYVYAYLLLSVVYAAACIQYLNSITRTASLAKSLQSPSSDQEPVSLTSDAERSDAQSAVRAILDIDSAAFACAVLPVAYIATTGLFGNLLTRNLSAAPTINPIWLLATLALVAGHMFFLAKIIGLNTRLTNTASAVLSHSFVSRHASVLTYYRVFVLLVTLFNVANTVYLLANLDSVTKLPFVM
jgi:hypothetical protein